MTNKEHKINQRIISSEASIQEALRKMDTIYQKLLIVLDESLFVGLISVGDIQRAIISNISLKTSIKEIIRLNPRICRPDESPEFIRKQMLEFRMEFMPIVDNNRKMLDVIFWEDLFDDKHKEEREPLHAKVVIMAGGKGTRLKPLSNVIPKPLIPLGEKPIIELIMDKFLDIGSNDFVLSVNYKAEFVEFHFSGKRFFRHKISYIKEEKPLGTAGSLTLLKGKINDAFFVTNCDILIDQDYREVWDYHKENGNQLTLVSSLKSLQIPYGTLKVGEKGQLLQMDEKPTLTYFINAGLYILEPQLIDIIPENTFYNITDLIEQIKNNNGKVGVFPVSEGSLKDIGTWAEYILNNNIKL